MSYTYYDAGPVADEATPILIPVAVGIASIALWILMFTLVFPWDRVPTPEVCEQVAVYKGIFGHVLDGYRTVCAPSKVYVGWTAFGAVLLSISASMLAVVATIRLLTRRSSNVS